MNLEVLTVSNYRYRDQVAYIRTRLPKEPWLVLFCSENPLEPRCGSLNSAFRLEPIPFDDCYLDRFFFLDPASNGELVGSAVTMRIRWNGTAADLPAGWEETVRRCFRDCRDAEGRGCNTLVGMQVFTLYHYRQGGLAGLFLDKMLALGRRNGYEHMLVPVLPPTQFQRENVEKPFEEIVSARRPDGLPNDHWVRLHVRKGARVLGASAKSHRFAASLRGFQEHITSDRVTRTGEHIVRLDRDLSFGRAAMDTWQRIYADVERDFVCFSWGCVWVDYDLKSKA